MILLDTDVCIEMLRGNRRVIEKRQNCDENIAVSFMSVAELYSGAEKSDHAGENLNLVDEFLFTVEILHTDLGILQKFGQLKARLTKMGTVLPDADLFTAAVALSKCSMLITGNIRHLGRIEELTIENWTR